MPANSAWSVVGRRARTVPPECPARTISRKDASRRPSGYGRESGGNRDFNRGSYFAEGLRRTSYPESTDEKKSQEPSAKGEEVRADGARATSPANAFIRVFRVFRGQKIRPLNPFLQEDAEETEACTAVWSEDLLPFLCYLL
jgi:hypothetical protein